MPVVFRVRSVLKYLCIILLSFIFLPSDPDAYVHVTIMRHLLSSFFSYCLTRKFAIHVTLHSISKSPPFPALNPIHRLDLRGPFAGSVSYGCKGTGSRSPTFNAESQVWAGSLILQRPFLPLKPASRFVSFIMLGNAVGR